MEEFKYKFSVIVPIYNVEIYLEEAIESVIKQNIGFERNIQLILVNDGSTDNSEIICLKYKEKYPNNIIYIKQENSGVCSARNAGIEYAEGEYINFLDGDDKWELDTFSKAYDFFENNKEQVDIVACRRKYFEMREGFHVLDYIFEKSRIIDILEEYTCCQLHVASTFIKSEMVKKHKFNVNLRYGEDAEYVTKIVLDKEKYGVLSDAIYYYRKRLDESSVLQNSKKPIEYYIDTLENLHMNLIKISKEKYGNVIPYIQYLIMYELQYRIRKIELDELDVETKKAYVDKIKEILNYIEDYIINEQIVIDEGNKIYVFNLKYGKNVLDYTEYSKGYIYFNNVPIVKLKNNKSIFKIDILEVEDNNLILEGRVTTVFPKEIFNIYLKLGKEKKANLELVNGNKSLYNNNILPIKEKTIYIYTYKIKLPLDGIKNIKFIFCYKDNNIKLKPTMGNFSKLSGTDNSYYVKDKVILIYQDKELKILRNRFKNRFKMKVTYAKILKKEKKYSIILYRILYYICKKINKKTIWLLSDRENKANDNGEHLFKYIVNQKNDDIKPYFVIDKKSEDYKRIKSIGKVIKANTIKHKIYFLMASKIISSNASNYVIDIFDEDKKYVKDLYNFQFVFLQHGIIKDDLSRWLKKYNKNIKMFVTSATKEYNSIINGNYGYTEKEVVLTGLPRYDELLLEKKKIEKKILIIPTWRKKIKGSYKDPTGESIYLDKFKHTEYFKFYNNLINDERIISVLKEKGYKCKFCLHPSHYKQYVDFKGNDCVEINKGFVDYQKEFLESSLLVTDYSSVFFDFAYLKKPVIYSQFDKESFFDGGHAYEKGYFDYEEDGFGPVCYDYESTVQEIIKAIKSDCKIKEEYLDKIEKFYFKFDTNNCKRVYENILKI